MTRGKTIQKKVTEMRLTPAVAQTRIRDIAQDTSKVVISAHAHERMVERDITDMDVFRVLRDGNVDEAPEKTSRHEWQCKVTKQLRGIRAVGVVTVFLLNGKLFVKTVEWEDLK